MSQPLIEKSKVIEKLKANYLHFDNKMLLGLPAIYSDDIEFTDPVHQVKGLKELTRYFESMLHGLDYCEFIFDRTVLSESGDEAVLFWAMVYQHKKLAGGKKLTITGNSHLRFAEKIYYHRDYFDMGAMLYEHIPVLGYAVKKIKKRLEK
jgi:SnoaL-like domain